jgi:hypothetical protein
MVLHGKTVIGLLDLFLAAFPADAQDVVVIGHGLFFLR